VAAAKLKWHLSFRSIEVLFCSRRLLIISNNHSLSLTFTYKITFFSFVFKNSILKFSCTATTWTYFLQDIMLQILDRTTVEKHSQCYKRLYTFIPDKMILL
jgi:hypothetical protein